MILFDYVVAFALFLIAVCYLIQEIEKRSK